MTLHYIHLRAQPGSVRPKKSFDLLTEAGKVKPKALNPAAYEWPNGASMRPNSATQQNLVRSFKGSTIYVYSVPEGTELPDDLILVHEFGDHYSLQAKEEMTVEGKSRGQYRAKGNFAKASLELDGKITNFLSTKGRRLTREEWLNQYPQATE
ncbi:conserved hypothetical protein [Histoplasma capsulatum H143]|uniref:Tse2 ADP-ribosyltransferase toxin domain-containing protein n=1 Tax=Ajellomyces capsulatus (strain H143) TaxID=544712 RepID=C6H8T4_AJECH|nr:conserved hypothetical protein [Histoplasma capsulatum H143]